MFTENQINEMCEKFKNILHELNENGKSIGSESEAKTLANHFMIKKIPELMQAVIESAQSRSSSKKICPHCGGKTKFVSRRKKESITRFGRITISEKYFTCYECKKSGFFNDKHELAHGKVDSDLAEILSLLCCYMPFNTAKDFVRRIFDLEISEFCIKETAEFAGKVLFENEEIEAHNIKPERIAEMCPEESPDLTYAMVDGGMINTKEGWKEAKLGLFFDQKDIIKNKSRKKKSKKKIINKTYVSSIAYGVKDFSCRFKLALMKSGKYWAKKFIVVSDGADWIKNMFSELFKGGYTHILDYYHAVEHIWECSKKLYGETSPKTKKWAKTMESLLWHGKVDRFFRLLNLYAQNEKNQTPIRDLYSYLYKRIDMIQYKEFRKMGYIIGSGAIESGIKNCIQARLKQTGMIWSKKGANAIAKLRSLYLSGNWDNVWLKPQAIPMK